MIGQKLGHHRILEKIGAGGMGEVYRARDEHQGRNVAIEDLGQPDKFTQTSVSREPANYGYLSCKFSQISNPR